jgi:primary-amine oxidase
MAVTITAPAATVHPLDPLSADEVERAWEILSAERSPSSKSRVIFIALHEPDKKVVLGHRPGDAVERAAFVVLVDGATGRTCEAVVSLSRGRVLSWEHVPGVQPAIVLDEFTECEAAVRADPRWQ